MYFKYFFVILLTLHVIHAQEDSDSDSLPVRRGMSRSTLKKRQRNMEDTIYDKFRKLEKNIIDSLEEYMDSKFVMLQKHIDRKISTLEQNMPDKSDINDIDRELKKLESNSNEEHVVCGSNAIDNGVVAQLNEKLNSMQQEIFKLSQTIANATNTENSNRVWTELQSQMDALHKKIPENFEQSTNLKLDAMGKQIVDLHKNISGEFASMENTVSNKFGEIQREIPILEETLNNTLNAIKNSSIVLQLPGPQLNEGYLLCQEREVTGYDFVPITMDHLTLKHTTVEYDSDGSLSHFETHLAIMGSNYNTHIQLSPTDHPTTLDRYFVLDFITTEQTRLRLVAPRQNTTLNEAYFHETVHTSDGVTLSTSEYTAFYLRINNGILEFGKEGSAPFLTYEDSKLKQTKYIGFTGWAHEKAKFLYDCPAGFEGILEFGKEGSAPFLTYEDSKLKQTKYIGFTGWAHEKAKFLYDCPAGFEASLLEATA